MLDRMRMQDETAPSFLSNEESEFILDPLSAHSLLTEWGDRAVIFFPSARCEDDGDWVKALRSALYVAVVDNGDEKRMKRFINALESQIFSPLYKPLTGAMLCSTKERAGEITTSVALSTGGKSIIIRAR